MIYNGTAMPTIERTLEGHSINTSYKWQYSQNHGHDQLCLYKGFLTPEEVLEKLWGYRGRIRGFEDIEDLKRLKGQVEGVLKETWRDMEDLFEIGGLVTAKGRVFIGVNVPLHLELSPDLRVGRRMYECTGSALGATYTSENSNNQELAPHPRLRLFYILPDADRGLTLIIANSMVCLQDNYGMHRLDLNFGKPMAESFRSRYRKEHIPQLIPPNLIFKSKLVEMALGERGNGCVFSHSELPSD